MRATLGCLSMLAAAALLAPAAVAEENPFYTACETLGGTYEERRTGCDPDCVTTYICRFDDGTGRTCDEEGSCGPLDGATESSSTSSAAPTSSSSESASGSEAASYEDCVSDARDACQDECGGMSRREALDCLRSCTEDACGNPDDDGDDWPDDREDEGSSTSSATSDSACSDCMSACKDDCADIRRPRQKQACVSKCKSKCEDECG